MGPNASHRITALQLVFYRYYTQLGQVQYPVLIRPLSKRTSRLRPIATDLISNQLCYSTTSKAAYLDLLRVSANSFAFLVSILE